MAPVAKSVPIANALMRRMAHLQVQVETMYVYMYVVVPHITMRSRKQGSLSTNASKSMTGTEQGYPEIAERMSTMSKTFQLLA